MGFQKLIEGFGLAAFGAEMNIANEKGAVMLWRAGHFTFYIGLPAGPQALSRFGAI